MKGSLERGILLESMDRTKKLKVCAIRLAEPSIVLGSVEINLTDLLEEL